MRVDTGGERSLSTKPTGAQGYWLTLKRRGVDACLIYYPHACHSGGWNDSYKADYMQRLVAWFGHSLMGDPLHIGSTTGGRA